MSSLGLRAGSMGLSSEGRPLRGLREVVGGERGKSGEGTSSYDEPGVSGPTLD